jgi:hypothetical protein
VQTIVLPVLAAMCLLGLGLRAAQTAAQTTAQTGTQPPGQAQPQINVSEYRDRAVPPNPSNAAGPAQPIPFSHKLHSSLGLQCSTCHQNAAQGARMTLPTAQTCMSCHSTVAADRPPIEKLAAYAKSGKPIPWAPVYVLLKGVNFSHQTHIAAQVQCETCHGQVTQMVVMRQATGVTAMSVCQKCHTMNDAPTTCQTCHSWPRIGPNGEPVVHP